MIVYLSVYVCMYVGGNGWFDYILQQIVAIPDDQCYTRDRDRVRIHACTYTYTNA